MGQLRRNYDSIKGITTRSEAVYDLSTAREALIEEYKELHQRADALCTDETVPLYEAKATVAKCYSRQSQIVGEAEFLGLDIDFRQMDMDHRPCPRAEREVTGGE